MVSQRVRCVRAYRHAPIAFRGSDLIKHIRHAGQFQQVHWDRASLLFIQKSRDRADEADANLKPCLDVPFAIYQGRSPLGYLASLKGHRLQLLAGQFVDIRVQELQHLGLRSLHLAVNNGLWDRSAQRFQHHLSVQAQVVPKDVVKFAVHSRFPLERLLEVRAERGASFFLAALPAKHVAPHTFDWAHLVHGGGPLRTFPARRGWLLDGGRRRAVPPRG